MTRAVGAVDSSAQWSRNAPVMPRNKDDVWPNMAG